jgi:DNA-binding LacI/PurR family transcriptional regulator
VSRATVSLALRNHPSIPASTREQIQRIAKEAGYHPSALVSTMLAQVRRRQPAKQRVTIAWLSAQRLPTDRLADEYPFVADLFAGARRRAEELGYRIEEFWAKEPGMTGGRLTGILLARNIRGLLLAPMPRPRGHLSLDWSPFAVAAVGYTPWRPAVHRAIVNHFEFTRDAFRRLARLGHRRIGLVIYHSLNERVNRQIRAAVLDCQQRIGRANRIPPLIVKRWDERDFRTWFLHYKPDGVLTTLAQIVDAIRACGRRIPEDVSCVFLGKHASLPGFTSIDNRGEAIGAAAVDLVVEQLHANEYGLPKDPKLVMVEGRWDDGMSVRQRAN